MNTFCKSFAAAALIGAAAFASTPASAARVSIGVGIGVPIGGYGYYGPGYWGPGYWGPSYYYGPGYYGPGAYVVEPPPRVVVQSAPVAQAPAAPDPIFYPNRGQSVAQTEVDRQECNRWATGQPTAMADASVFQRATYACMEGRGYTVK